MPLLSRLLVRAALVHLALGATLGALTLAQKAVPLHTGLWQWLAVHMECALVGWLVQFAMGVAYWILPRFDSGTRRGRPSGAWAAFGLLNAGVVVVGLAAVRVLPPGLAPLGRCAELAAAGAFFWHIWPRVRPLLAEQVARSARGLPDG